MILIKKVVSMKTNMLAQSAMEYLTTYGWAILIIAVALSVLFYLGVFNPSKLVSSQCIFPGDFTCLGSSIASGGLATINFEQSSQYNIKITAYGCNTQPVTTEMTQLSTPITLNIGSNYTFTNIQCYNNTLPFTGQAGSLFNGYIIFNYTDIQTGFQKQAVGTLIQKVE